MLPVFISIGDRNSFRAERTAHLYRVASWRGGGGGAKEREFTGIRNKTMIKNKIKLYVVL